MSVTKKLDLAKEKNAECRAWQLQEGQVAFFCTVMVEGFWVGYEGVRNKTSAKINRARAEIDGANAK